MSEEEADLVARLRSVNELIKALERERREAEESYADHLHALRDEANELSLQLHRLRMNKS